MGDKRATVSNRVTTEINYAGRRVCHTVDTCPAVWNARFRWRFPVAREPILSSSSHHGETRRPLPMRIPSTQHLNSMRTKPHEEKQPSTKPTNHHTRYPEIMCSKPVPTPLPSSVLALDNIIHGPYLNQHLKSYTPPGCRRLRRAATGERGSFGRAETASEGVRSWRGRRVCAVVYADAEEPAADGEHLRPVHAGSEGLLRHMLLAETSKLLCSPLNLSFVPVVPIFSSLPDAYEVSDASRLAPLEAFNRSKPVLAKVTFVLKRSSCKMSTLASIVWKRAIEATCPVECHVSSDRNDGIIMQDEHFGIAPLEACRKANLI